MIRYVEHFDKIRHMVLSLLILLSIMIAGGKIAFAQNTDLSGGIIDIEVSSIQDNRAFCKNGIVVDFSNAQNQRQIEVGDLLRASGTYILDGTSSGVFKADITRVQKMRDVTLTSTLQSVTKKSSTQVEIQILNQKILINKDLFASANVGVGDGVVLVSESTAEGLVPFIIFAAGVGNMSGFGSTITAIDGNKVTLQGGFTATLSEQSIQVLMQGNSFMVGARVGGWIKKISKAKVVKFDKKAGTPIPSILTSAVFGQLQAIDTTNNTITIFNQKIQITPNTFISFSDDQSTRISLTDIDLNNIKEAYINLGEDGLGNFYLVNYNVTLKISLTKKF